MINRTSRRDFVRLAGLAAGACVLGRGSLAALAADLPQVPPPSRKIPVGVQLYSVRNELKNDFSGVIEKIGKMGYQGVEFAGYYGWEKKPTELRKLLDDNGLKCCGTHTGLATIEGDNLQKTIDLHKALGNKFLICPGMNGKDGAGWQALAKKFNDISAKAKEQGMLVGYHAHGGDFKKFDGKTAWEIFFDNTNPDVVHQIDTDNATGGGGDPAAMIKKYAGRSKTVHIKEHGAGAAPVGEGKIDWKTILPLCEDVGGTEWYVIEHESGKTPLESIKACLDNLHKMGR